MSNLNNFINNKNLNLSNKLSNEIKNDRENKDSSDSSNFINQDNQKQCDEPKNQKPQSTDDIKEKLNSSDSLKLNEIIESLKNTQVRPISNQQRNLDREEGGVEHENHEDLSQIVDEWDNRGQEVMEMGKHNPINKSSAKKSMIWNLKRKKLQQKKIDEELENISDDLKKLKNQERQNNQEGEAFDSRKRQNLIQKIQALRQDQNDFNPPNKTR